MLTTELVGNHSDELRVLLERQPVLGLRDAVINSGTKQLARMVLIKVIRVEHNSKARL